jgi:dTDP-3-amino-3,4,6-trideoxy-alpha-D-glucose transaminase
MDVPFVALDRQHAAIADCLRAAFERVLGASSFVLGTEVERFEQAFAEYCAVRHCVGVASGTAALRLLLEATGVGEGDEVIIPAHTFVASALAAMDADAIPVLCDVEPETGLIDVGSAAAMIGPRTAAIMPVHLYGQMCDLDAVRALAARHGLAVVEDAAQAHGASLRGVRAGRGSTGAAFSFYPSKNLGALGDGGAICTNHVEIAERARRLRNLGQRRKGEYVEPGYNERLDGLQAALLLEKLPHLDAWNEQRRRHAAVYAAGLPDAMRLLEERQAAPCTYHVFPVRVAHRDRVAAALAAHGVSSGVHYSPAVHAQPLWNGCAPRRDAVSGAEEWARDELSLPMFPELTGPEMEWVVEACHEAVKA